jgi:hypothetical protein
MPPSGLMRVAMKCCLEQTSSKRLQAGIRDGTRLVCLLMYSPSASYAVCSGMAIPQLPFADGSRIGIESGILLIEGAEDQQHMAGRLGRLAGQLSWPSL